MMHYRPPAGFIPYVVVACIGACATLLVAAHNDVAPVDSNHNAVPDVATRGVSGLTTVTGRLPEQPPDDEIVREQLEDLSADVGATVEFRAVIRGRELLAADLGGRSARWRALRYVNFRGEVGFFFPDGHAVPQVLLTTPVLAPRVTSGFGLRRLWGRRFEHLHGGIDVAAPRGTPVHAVADGTVRESGSHGSYGNLVVIAHRNGLESRYGHLSATPPGLIAGARVRRGTVIGYVGDTGLATGPHLHFELRAGGHILDPGRRGILTGEALSGVDLATFRAQTGRALAELDRAR